MPSICSHILNHVQLKLCGIRVALSPKPSQADDFCSWFAQSVRNATIRFTANENIALSANTVNRIAAGFRLQTAQPYIQLIDLFYARSELFFIAGSQQPSDSADCQTIGYIAFKFCPGLT